MAVLDANAGILSYLLIYATEYVTGDMGMTLLCIYGFLVLVCLALDIPVEIAIAAMLPFIYTSILLAGGGIFLALLGIGVLLIATVAAKYFFAL